MVPIPFTTSYACCRDGFRAIADDVGVAIEPWPIPAPGPDGLALTIDVATLGERMPQRALVVMAGVHGVEGFACSPIMCDALERWGDIPLDDGVGVILVHAINPWGMAWWRRQNESNVDLNRNWGVGAGHDANPGYAELHGALCPDGPTPPDPDEFLERTRAFVDEHGEDWVRAAVSDGQSTHPDGLYYTGHQTEASTAAMADIARAHLTNADEIVVVDLHTGYGAYGDMTLLARHEPETPGDRWTRTVFADVDVVNTARPGDSSRRGQIAGGLADVVPHATFHAVTAELGTRSDITMILAERAEHWVHRHGDRDDPEHARILEHHLRCSTPDEAAWQAAAIEHGRRVLDQALAAVTD